MSHSQNFHIVKGSPAVGQGGLTISSDPVSNPSLLQGPPSSGSGDFYQNVSHSDNPHQTHRSKKKLPKLALPIVHRSANPLHGVSSKLSPCRVKKKHPPQSSTYKKAQPKEPVAGWTFFRSTYNNKPEYQYQLNTNRVRTLTRKWNGLSENARSACANWAGLREKVNCLNRGDAVHPNPDAGIDKQNTDHAYLLFYKEELERGTYCEVPYNNILGEVALKWIQLSDEEQQVFLDQSEGTIIGIPKEKQASFLGTSLVSDRPPARSRPPARKSATVQIGISATNVVVSHVLSSYQVFFREINKNPKYSGKNVAETSALASSQWNEMSSEEKKKFESQAEIERKRKLTYFRGYCKDRYPNKEVVMKDPRCFHSAHFIKRETVNVPDFSCASPPSEMEGVKGTQDLTDIRLEHALTSSAMPEHDPLSIAAKTVDSDHPMTHQANTPGLLSPPPAYVYRSRDPSGATTPGDPTPPRFGTPGGETPIASEEEVSTRVVVMGASRRLEELSIAQNDTTKQLTEEEECAQILAALQNSSH